MKKHIPLVLIGCFLLPFHTAFPQKKRDLEDKKQKLQQEIDYKNKLLGEVKNDKKKSMTLLAIINNKIADREELINAISSQINELDGQISDKRTVIQKKEKEIQKLKDEYARMLYFAYVNRSAYDRLMFVFASKDFGQAYQRLRYFQLYAEFRERQVKRIQDAKKELTQQAGELEGKKSEHKVLLNDKEAEKNNLSREKEDKEGTLNELQKREKELKEELRKKQMDAAKLKKAIEKIIEDEVRKQKNVPKNTRVKITLTPEEEQLGNNFSGNKGKLPWPLAEGTPVEHFGRHPHPELDNVEVNNLGVDIATNKGADVRAVFDGEVKAVAQVGGLSGKVVLIRHGEYLSVYQNLEEVYVKTGQKVKTKQAIGKVLTDDDNRTVLQFQIWKGNDLTDPEDWLAGKAGK